jgi:cobalt/nickel transport system permease protein
MHMADALISPAVGGVMWAVAGAGVAVSSRAMTRSLDTRQVPLMGVMGAFIFAAQMINFSVPGTGSSGHFTGGILLALLLGRYAAFLTITSVLIMQAVFFGDGGLLALGANIFNMGLVSCFIVYPLLAEPFLRSGRALRRVTIWLACVVALQLGALGVVMETTASGIAELPFSAFVLAMAPIHLAIGVVEGLITLAVLEFAERAGAGLLVAGETGAPRRLTGALAALALLTGGVLSWFASTHPDGLEWSVARLTGQKELSERTDSVHAALARIQDKTAFLPDYSFPAEAKKKDGTKESGWGAPNAGTSVSGLAGSVLTLLLAGLAGWLFRRRRADGVSAQ